MKYNNAKIIIIRQCYIMILFFCAITFGWSQNNMNQNLVLFAQDVRIEEQARLGGFYLYVIKKNGVNSVLLTESSETPARDSNTYAFRTLQYNNINGNEKRVLREKFIKPKDGYFIIDSTPEPDIQFGSAFVLFLPYEVEFGYENTRRGTLDLRKNSVYMSIRTFSESYASYSGEFADNSFYLERQDRKPPLENVINIREPDFDIKTLLRDVRPNQDPNIGTFPNLSPKLLPPSVGKLAELPTIQTAELPTTTTLQSLDGLLNPNSTDKYSSETISSFTEIAKKNNTVPFYVEDSNDIIDKIVNVLRSLPKEQSVDVVIALDTTRSMWDDLKVIKDRLIPNVEKIMQGRIYRVGVVFYRDFDEEYVVKRINFSDRLDSIQRNIDEAQTEGGGDWAEAVYEALEEAVNYTWVAENRIIFIVGDAPPHEIPLTEVDVKQLYATIAAKKIIVYPMIVPK